MLDLYAAHKQLFWMLAVALPVLACLAYEFGWRRPAPGKAAAGLESFPVYVRRFSIAEMIRHWLCILLGLVVIGTGIAQIFSRGGHSHLGPLHGWLGLVLLIICVINLACWSRSCCFCAYDWKWLAVMGGYLDRGSRSGNKAHSGGTAPPAGRFNAGQKLYFWAISILAILLFGAALAMEYGGHGSPMRTAWPWSLHGLAGCLFTAMVIGHAYLSLFINPPTARVLLDGKISRQYLREHHSEMEI